MEKIPVLTNHDEKLVIGALQEFKTAIDDTTEVFIKLFKPFFKWRSTQRRWRMTAPTGRNKKQQKFDQTRLKGRGKKERRKP